MPSNHHEIRSQWITSINRHQHCDENLGHFHICSKHFSDDCFKPNSKRVSLLSSAVPTIFETPRGLNNYGGENNSCNEPNSEINRSNQELRIEINKLRRNLTQNRLQFHIEKQAMQVKTESLTKKCEEYRANFIELKKKSQSDENEKRKITAKYEELKNKVNFIVVISNIYSISRA